ncbi:MAG: lysis protein [Azonexus sp.]|jgi:hypothetical protein|nr:lysis protein [Azonexus sp.]
MSAVIEKLLSPISLTGRAIALALMAALALGVYTAVSSIYEAGRGFERGLWQAREAEELIAANAEIARLVTAARAAEQAHSAAMAAAALSYQEKITHETHRRDRVIADLRNGALRLRDPGPATTGQNAACDPAAQTSTAAAGGDDPPAPGLSRPTAEFLVGEAARADAVAVQLAACQTVVVADRQQQQPQGDPK